MTEAKGFHSENYKPKMGRDRKGKQDANGAQADDLEALGEWDAGEDDDAIPPREWLLGTTFCRGLLSSLQGAGATGKTALVIAQALAMATAHEITGEHVFQRCRVLMITLEDDRNELRRRVKAARLYHGIDRAELRGWLFLAAVGAKGWKIATLEDGKVCPSALKDKIVDAIDRHRIDVVIIDPLVKTHSVEENSNPQMDAVASILTEIATEHNCAVGTPHHVSKGAAEPGNADRGRGASAFKDAGRLVKTLASMSKEEANIIGRHGIRPPVLDPHGHRQGQSRAAPGETIWFQLVGVRLDNATELYPSGDEVQTVERWSPPKLFDDLSHPLLNEILTAIDTGMPDGRRYSSGNAAKARAAWKVVKQYAPAKTEKQAKEIIGRWIGERFARDG